MTRFIYVRDNVGITHYINVNHIIHVTKYTAADFGAELGYIYLRDGKEVLLSADKFDTVEDVITKIQAAMA